MSYGLVELSSTEISEVTGTGPLNDAGSALQGAAVVGGALALIPTPASGGLAVFSLVAGGLGTLLSWADSRINWQS